MANPASAQLVSAITANQTLINIQSVVTPTGSIGFPAVGVFNNFQQPLIIDQEIMYIVQQPTSGVLLVRSRGAEGTLATAHDALANVYTGAATDFGAAPAGTSGFFDANLSGVVSIGSAIYTVTLGPGDTVFNINVTGGGAAITLPTPIGGMNGTMYRFTSNTANAHVITCTSGIQSGSGAQPKSTITFAAVIGASVGLVAENGFWNVVSPSAGITVS